MSKKVEKGTEIPKVKEGEKRKSTILRIGPYVNCAKQDLEKWVDNNTIYTYKTCAYVNIA